VTKVLCERTLINLPHLQLEAYETHFKNIKTGIFKIAVREVKDSEDNQGGHAFSSEM
jgi:hypothetical protein